MILSSVWIPFLKKLICVIYSLIVIDICQLALFANGYAAQCLRRSPRLSSRAAPPFGLSPKRGWPADDMLPIGRQLNPTNSMKERTAEQSLSLFMSYNHKKSRCFNKVFKGLSCDFCSNMELFSILQVQLYFQDGEGNNRYGQPDRQANSAIPRKGRPQPGGLSRSRFAEHDRNF